MGEKVNKQIITRYNLWDILVTTIILTTLLILSTNKLFIGILYFPLLGMTIYRCTRRFLLTENRVTHFKIGKKTKISWDQVSKVRIYSVMGAGSLYIQIFTDDNKKFKGYIGYSQINEILELLQLKGKKAFGNLAS